MIWVLLLVWVVGSVTFSVFRGACHAEALDMTVEDP